MKNETFKKLLPSKDIKISKTVSSKQLNVATYRNYTCDQEGSECIEKMRYSFHKNKKRKISDALEKDQNILGHYITLLARSDPLLYSLQKRHISLLKKIRLIEQRLFFISSTSLRSACNEIKEEDILVLCQINDYLIRKQQ